MASQPEDVAVGSHSHKRASRGALATQRSQAALSPGGATLGALQGTAGNGAVARLLRSRQQAIPRGLRATRMVGATHDPLEREADRVAEEVMRRWTAGASRACAEDVGEVPVQRRADPGNDPASAFQADASVAQRLAARSGAGYALPAGAVQRTIGGWGSADRWRRPILGALKDALGRQLTSPEEQLVDRLRVDSTNYSLAQVVQVIEAKARPGATSGGVTLVEQTTGPPSPATKTDVDFSTSTNTTLTFKGEKARAVFSVFVELQEAPLNTEVGYLQTLRFSRRSLEVDGRALPVLGLSHARDGAEANAPWMVSPVAAVGRPVLITMEDEPGQWGRLSDPDVSAQGIDIFSTWLVSTQVRTPTRIEDVEFLYHWDWEIDWTNKRCTVRGAGAGKGANTPAFSGKGARKQYNDFIRNNMLTSEGIVDRFHRALGQLKEGLKGPNVDTQVGEAMLEDIVKEMRESWEGMGTKERDAVRSAAIGALNEYVIRVQRRRPAQRYLGEELGFTNLTA